MEFITEVSKLVEGLNIQNYDQLKKLKKELNSENSHSVFKLYYTQKDEYYLTIDNYLKENGEANSKKFTASQIGMYIYIRDEIGKYLMVLTEERSTSS